MSQFLRPNVILLRDGVDSSQGKQQIISNINQSCQVVDIVKSTLGPRGMDKLMFTEGQDEQLITNDGQTVMKELNIVHPQQRILTDIQKSQDMEVGDGTTSVVVICGELLKEQKNFLEQGVCQNTIIRGYRKQQELQIKKLEMLQVDLSEKNKEEKDQMLKKCQETTLNSKLVQDYKSFFQDMVVRQINLVGEEQGFDHRAVGMKKIIGGSVTDSMLVEGVQFKKCFSYQGFEQQPKSFDNPKILLLNLELELKQERENQEIRIGQEDFQSIVDQEWKIIYEKLDKIQDAGTNIVLSTQQIGDLQTQYFQDRGIFCQGRVEKQDMERTRKATGQSVQTTVTQGLQDSVFGSCGRFEERQISGERWNLFMDCKESKSQTMIIRGGQQQFIDEQERSIHDSLMIVKSQSKNTKVVGGGGQIELEISRFLKEYQKEIIGKEQRVIEQFQKQLEIIPRTLIQNSGGDQTDLLNKLRKKHQSQDADSRWYGVDCLNLEIQDTMKNFVWEPMVVKENQITQQSEQQCLILSIDETITNPQSEQQKGGGKGKGKGKGGGMGQGMMNQLGGGKGMGRGMRQLKNNMV